MKILGLILLLAGAAPLGAWEIQGSLSGLAGLTYGGRWEPGWSASAVEAEVRIPFGESWKEGSWTGGMEYAAAGLGSQVSFPVGVTWSPSLETASGWSWNLGLKILPGLTLTRPRPLVLLGAEASAGIRWNWKNGWFAGAGTGLRFTVCPEYSARVAEYSLWDVPLGLEAGWRLP